MPDAPMTPGGGQTTIIPWNSISESVLPREERRLNYSEGAESPCLSCSTAPCCTHLPLNTFRVTNMVELDHAVYLLNFDRIELGLAASGEWSSMYKYPCRFLDRDNFMCTVHDTPEQPRICQTYDPFKCWYRRNLTQSIGENYLRIDRQRLQFIVDRIVFDADRNILEVPDWDTMTAGFAELPMEAPPPPTEPLASTPVREQWIASVISMEEIAEPSPEPRTYASLNNPCDGCAAYCCQRLIFPHPGPTSAQNLDYLRFALGFPGVSLGIADNGWALVVESTCRHLGPDNQCTVFGQPERPLLCKYYDAWKCTYKTNFGQPRPEDYLLVQLEDFPRIAECFLFDEDGAITAQATMEDMRGILESWWRSRALGADMYVDLEAAPAP